MSNTTIKYVSILTHWNFWTLLQTDTKLIQQFVSILQNNEFEAYYFNTPCVNETSLNKTFEFVLVYAEDLLEAEEDGEEFEEHFTESSPAVSFINLGKYCDLVSPNPLSNQTNYTHLGSFVRTAHKEQIQGLMKFLGKQVLDRVHDEQPELKYRNVWVSTSGNSVPWLHVRLCNSPAYYWYAPYKNSCIIPPRRENPRPTPESGGPTIQEYEEY